MSNRYVHNKICDDRVAVCDKNSRCSICASVRAGVQRCNDGVSVCDETFTLEHLCEGSKEYVLDNVV